MLCHYHADAYVGAIGGNICMIEVKKGRGAPPLRLITARGGPGRYPLVMPTHTTADIATLFPNLMDIQDKALRDNVAAVWSEALNSGCGGKGWTFDEIRAIPFTLLAGNIDLRFVEHLNSCCKQCIAITGVLREVFGSRVPIHLDHLIAGSLLADVGKMLEFDKDASGKVIKGRFGDMLRHPFSGVALCYKHHIPAEVMHIIATHSHEGDKVDRTIESWIFHHADFIDFDIAKVLGKKAAGK